MRKFASIILCISILMGIAGSISYAADEKEAANDLTIAVNLGIMDLSCLTQPEKTFTRGELVSLVVKLLGDDTTLAEIPFTDVQASSIYYDAVSRAYAGGIVVGYGDGTFRPDDTATVADAAQMLVRAVGYKELLDGGMSISSALGRADIGSTSDGGNFTEITAQKLAALMLDACEANLVEISSVGNSAEYEYSDELLMERYLNIYKAEGIVTANQFTSLDSEEGAGEGAICIDNARYDDKDGKYADYLGYNTVTYYREDDDSSDKEILYMYPLDNDVTKIAADDIDEYRDGALYYDVGSRSRHIDIQLAAVDFVYNNSFALAPSAEDFEFESGEVTLIDNNDDGEIDFLRIDSYENYVVSYADRNSKAVFGKYNTEPVYIEDYENVSFTAENGDAMYIEELFEWDVISVQKSRNGKNLRMIYATKNIDGTIDGKSSEDGKTTVTVDGVEYLVTADCVRYYEKQLAVGTSGEFCLDAFGKIAALKTEEAEKYGWFIRLFGGYDLEIPEAKIMAADGSIQRLPLAKTVRYDGTRMDSDDLAVGSYGMLISYKVNASGEISYIDTENESNKEISGNTLVKYYDGYTKNAQTGVITETEALKYKSGGKIFGGRVALDAQTLIFQIPTDESAAGEEDYWSLTTSIFKNDADEYIQAYKRSNEDLAADVIVVYNDTLAAETVKNDTEITVVDKIQSTVDEDGELVTLLTGYRGSKQVSLKFRDEAMLENMTVGGEPCTLSRGDVVKLSVNQRNEIIACDIVYSYSQNTLSTSNPSGSIYDIFYVQLAYAYAKDGDLCYTTTTDLSKGTFTGGEDDLSTLELRNLSRYTILRVDTEERTVEKADVEHIAAYKQAGAKASKILIYDRYGDPRTIVIYN